MFFAKLSCRILLYQVETSTLECRDSVPSLSTCCLKKSVTVSCIIKPRHSDALNNLTPKNSCSVYLLLWFSSWKQAIGCCRYLLSLGRALHLSLNQTPSLFSAWQFSSSFSLRKWCRVPQLSQGLGCPASSRRGLSWGPDPWERIRRTRGWEHMKLPGRGPCSAVRTCCLERHWSMRAEGKKAWSQSQLWKVDQPLRNSGSVTTFSSLSQELL